MKDKITKRKNILKIQTNRRTDWTIEFYLNFGNIALNTKKTTLIVIDQRVADLYGADLDNLFSTISDKLIITILAGEKNKSLKSVENIIDAAQEIKMNGDGLMIAVGGGSVSDVVSYAASIYRRGVEHIRIPTTLLGQVDASIGIKNGINYSISHKNFLGTFYPASRVIICNEFLKTLSHQHIAQGVAEILKLAIITDQTLFALVEKEKEKITNYCEYWDHPIFSQIVFDSILGMEKKLKNNFYEHNIKREVNFGHEIAHTLESRSDYQLSHGETVAINVALSCAISFLLKKLSEESLQRILNLFLYFKLPIWHPLLDDFDLRTVDSITRAQRRGNLHYVIPSVLGRAAFLEVIDEDILKKAVRLLNEYARQN